MLCGTVNEKIIRPILFAMQPWRGCPTVAVGETHGKLGIKQIGPWRGPPIFIMGDPFRVMSLERYPPTGWHPWLLLGSPFGTFKKGLIQNRSANHSGTRTKLLATAIGARGKLHHGVRESLYLAICAFAVRCSPCILADDYHFFTSIGPKVSGRPRGQEY